MKNPEPRPTLEEIVPGEAEELSVDGRSMETGDEIQTFGRRRSHQIRAKQKARGEGATRAEKSEAARDIARKLVTDPKYQRELLSRLRAGVAGNIEIWLWRYAWGDPQKNEEELERERARFEKMRAQVIEFLKQAPDRAHLLDGMIQRAPRLLPRPETKHVPIDIPVVPKGTDGNT